MRFSPLANLPLTPSLICLGVAGYGSDVPEDESFRLMDHFYSKGGNFFDTAHIYASWLSNGHGASERTLGKWIRARGLEGKVLVCTKGAHPDLKSRVSRMSEREIQSDVRESLERLGMEKVDLYLLHRDDPSVPVADILGWLESHKQAGRITAYGSSNWSPARQREAALIARKNGYSGFQVSQIGFSLALSHLGDETGALFMDAETHAYHRESGHPVMGYSAQANGFFSGKYSPAYPAGPDGTRTYIGKRYGTPDNFNRLALAQQLAKERGVTANQIALAWLVNQPFPTFAVIGTRLIEQLDDAMASMNVVLTDQEWKALHEGRATL